MCDLLAAPERTVINNPAPRFSWIVNDAAPQARQNAYQILVRTTAAPPGDDGGVWNSTRIASADSVAAPYAGTPLAPHTTYAWQVRTWNDRDEPSPWSDWQEFRTGALKGPPTFARYPVVQTEVPPRRIVPRAPGHVFLDFGRAAFATLRVTLESPADGIAVTVHLGETLAAPDVVNRQPAGTIRYRRATLTLRQGRHPYTLAIPPDARNTGPAAVLMPKHIGEVLPFRYAELEGLPGPLAADDVRQLAAHYPFDDRAAQFSSDSDVLNAAWELCRYSVKATSFCGVYVDGDRERIPYTADAYLNQLSHYAVDREFTLARVSAAACIATPTWPTEWILHAPLMAWADYLHTGNPDLIHRLYADLEASTLCALRRADGLISTRTGLVTDALIQGIHMEHAPRPLEDIVDWPPAAFTDGGQGERDGYDMVAINTVVNAFHYRALVLMARMAAAIHRGDDAARFHALATATASSINRVLFDAARGVYVDGEGSSHSALHANLFPLAFGLVPPEHLPGVLAFIQSRGMACSVYAAQYLLEALYRAGADRDALELMTATHDRSWWNMLAVGSTVTLEAWDIRYKKNLDWNHAWGAAPANIIPRFVVGIRPLDPGFARVLIQPQPGGLRRAALTLPTIRGPIRVRFESAPEHFELELELPANVTARVILPPRFRTPARAWLDNHPRPDAVTPEGVVFEAIGSGPHTVRSAGGAS